MRSPLTTSHAGAANAQGAALAASRDSAANNRGGVSTGTAVDKARLYADAVAVQLTFQAFSAFVASFPTPAAATLDPNYIMVALHHAQALAQLQVDVVAAAADASWSAQVKSLLAAAQVTWSTLSDYQQTYGQRGALYPQYLMAATTAWLALSATLVNLPDASAYTQTAHAAEGPEARAISAVSSGQWTAAQASLALSFQATQVQFVAAVSPHDPGSPSMGLGAFENVLRAVYAGNPAVVMAADVATDAAAAFALMSALVANAGKDPRTAQLVLAFASADDFVACVSDVNGLPVVPADVVAFKLEQAGAAGTYQAAEDDHKV